MNRRTPGFHAEASVYQSRARVATAGHGLEVGAGVVTPAAEWYDYACAAACSAACVPAAGAGFHVWHTCIDECNAFCTGHPLHVTGPRTILRA
jgi:hypothetical protein